MTLYEELKKFSKKKKIASRVYNHEIKESLKIQLTRNRHMRESPSLHFFFFFFTCPGVFNIASNDKLRSTV